MTAMELQWRLIPMKAAHLDQVVALEQVCFARPWSKGAFRSELTLPHSSSHIAKTTRCLESGSIIAYVCTQRILDELTILKIAVSAGWRSLGVGTAILRRIMGAAHQTGAKTVSLEVRPSNAGAVSFYRRLGLEVIGRRPGYYPETGEDALIMGKSLEGEST